MIGRAEEKLLRRRHQRARADERDREARGVRGAEVNKLQAAPRADLDEAAVGQAVASAQDEV